MWFSAEILAEISRNGVHEMIPDAYEMNSDPKVQQQMMWLLDLMVSHPKSKVRVHISENALISGTCIKTRKEKIEKAGLSVKEKFKPFTTKFARRSSILPKFM